MKNAERGKDLSTIKWDLIKTNSDGTKTVEENADCWKHMDYLADLLIRYSFKQQEDVESITFSKWESSSGTGNYVKVEYKDNNGNTQTAYFDYVTTDKMVRFSLIRMVKIIRHLRIQVRLLELLYLRRLLILKKVLFGVHILTDLKRAEKMSNIQMV